MYAVIVNLSCTPKEAEDLYRRLHDYFREQSFARSVTYRFLRHCAEFSFVLDFAAMSGAIQNVFWLLQETQLDTPPTVLSITGEVLG